MSTELAKNFSRRAMTYEDYAEIQSATAALFMEYAPATAPARILDVGAGTGILTRLIRRRFPACRVVALDASPAMLAAFRRGVAVSAAPLVGDAQAMPLRGAVDWIASHAVFHWLDLERTLGECRRLLAPGGALTFSAFGPATFRELGEAVASILPAAPPLTASAFPRRDELAARLDRVFPAASVEERILTREYPSLLDLLRRIHYTGTRGRGLGGLRLNRTTMQRIEERYRARHGRLAVTLQIFYCRAAR